MPHFIFLKMDVKNMAFTLVMLFLFTFIEGNHSFFNHIALNNAPSSTPSSIILPIQGTIGKYTVTLNIGNPSKPFALLIDTGSNLTWVKCDKPARTNYHRPSQTRYETHNNFVPCGNSLCAHVPKPRYYHGCRNPNNRCDYLKKYLDESKSRGVLVHDNIHLEFTDMDVQPPSLVFGCGYKQKNIEEAGILGLGNAEYGILSQLHNLGLIRNVMGHCLRKQGGFMFFGDRFNSLPQIVWSRMAHSSSSSAYTVGPADILFNGDKTSIKDLEVVFDSGTKYIHLNSQAYKAVLERVTNDLKETPLKRTNEYAKSRSCWKGSGEPFKSLDDVKHYFKPLTLVFRDNVQLQLRPESYLYFKKKEDKVCLGIFENKVYGDNAENIIGAIALRDKLVVYDNENQQIGWAEECPNGGALAL